MWYDDIAQTLHMGYMYSKNLISALKRDWKEELYRVAHKKRPELSHGIMQQRNQNESTD